MVGRVESTSNGAESTWAGAPRESSTSRCRTAAVALNPVGVPETTFEFPPGAELRIDWLATPSELYVRLDVIGSWSGSKRSKEMAWALPPVHEVPATGDRMVDA